MKYGFLLIILLFISCISNEYPENSTKIKIRKNVLSSENSDIIWKYLYTEQPVNDSLKFIYLKSASETLLFTKNELNYSDNFWGTPFFVHTPKDTLYLFQIFHQDTIFYIWKQELKHYK